MTKIDFKKELKELYRPTHKEVSVVTVPPMQYLMIDGEGPPENNPLFEGAMEALYPLAYKLKFMAKLGPLGMDYVVPPLEGLWWANDFTAFEEDRRDEWKWTLMIMQPDFITRELYEEALEVVRKKSDPRRLAEVRLQEYDEGESCQIMHIGPFSEERTSVLKLFEKVKELGKSSALKHHEIYLSDPRKTAPEKMKTVLRHPIR